MTDYTLTLTPLINRAVGANLTGVGVADEKIPKDWSAEGALDTITAAKVSIQRTGYIGTYKTDASKLAKTYEVGDQATAPGLITKTQASTGDASVDGMTTYPGLSIA